jgi:hypothetical protein
VLSEKRSNSPPELSKFSKQWKVEVAFKIQKRVDVLDDFSKTQLETIVKFNNFNLTIIFTLKTLV